MEYRIYCLTNLVFPELPTTDPSLPLSVSFTGGTPLVADGTVTVATAVNRDASVTCRLSGGAGTIDCKRLACTRPAMSIFNKPYYHTACTPRPTGTVVHICQCSSWNVQCASDGSEWF